MTKKRSTGVTVFAILNLVFGGLGLTGSLCAAVMLVATPAILQQAAPNAGGGPGQRPGPDMQAYQKYLEANVPGFVAIQWGTLGFNMVLYVILILAGIALLRMSMAGRWLSIVYCVLEIALVVATAIHNMVVVGPVADEFFRQQGEPFPGGLLAGLSSFGGCPCLLYSVILFVFVVLPGTGAALTTRPADDFTSKSDDYYDPDFQRQRRELPPES